MIKKRSILLVFALTFVAMVIFASPAMASTDVKTFGARGDGITDDTTAIQSCINSVNSNGGGVVYFPPGVYLM